MDLRDEVRSAGDPAIETLPVVPLRDNVVGVEDTVEQGNEVDALAGSVKSLFGEYVVAGAAVAPEVAVAVSRTTEPARIADVCSAAPDIAAVDKVALLQELDVGARLR